MQFFEPNPFPAMPDEYLDGDELFPAMPVAEELTAEGDGPELVRLPGQVALESREFSHILDVIDAAHAFLEEDKPLAVLERAYRRYTDFCEGSQRSLRAVAKNSFTAQVRSLQRLLQETAPLVRGIDSHAALQRKWDKVEEVAERAGERLAVLMMEENP